MHHQMWWLRISRPLVWCSQISLLPNPTVVNLASPISGVVDLAMAGANLASPKLDVAVLASQILRHRKILAVLASPKLQYFGPRTTKSPSVAGAALASPKNTMLQLLHLDPRLTDQLPHDEVFSQVTSPKFLSSPILAAAIFDFSLFSRGSVFASALAFAFGILWCMSNDF